MQFLPFIYVFRGFPRFMTPRSLVYFELINGWWKSFSVFRFFSDTFKKRHSWRLNDVNIFCSEVWPENGFDDPEWTDLNTQQEGFNRSCSVRSPVPSTVRDSVLSVVSGCRPERQPAFDEECWQLMEACWNGDPSLRPLLGIVQPILQSIMERLCGSEQRSSSLEDSSWKHSRRTHRRKSLRFTKSGVVGVALIYEELKGVCRGVRFIVCALCICIQTPH